MLVLVFLLGRGFELQADLYSVCCVAQSIKKKSSLSDTRFTKARERVYVIFRGKTYKIATHVHSHPGTGPSNNPLQISQMDVTIQPKSNSFARIQ